MKKILIKGAYGTKNFGDDLLMIITSRILRSKGCSVDILAPNHKYVTKLAPECKLNTYNKDNGYNTLVYGGGTQFYDFEGANNNSSSKKGVIRKKAKSLLSLMTSPRRIKGAILRRVYKSKPIESRAYIGLGLGPFHKDEVKDRTLESFQNSLFIGVRDKKSLAYLNSVNIDAVLGADLCFSHYFYEVDSVQSDIEKQYDLGVILRDWALSKEGHIAEFSIDELVKNSKNKKIIFIFFSKVHDSEWINFCQRRGYEYLVWDPDKDSVTEFLYQISRCQHILSSRFHGLVVSSLLKIPFTGLAIEPKISLFLDKFKSFDCVSYPFKSEQILQSIEQNQLWTEEAESAVKKEKELSESMIINFQDRMTQ